MISISALLDDGRTGKMNMILCDEALRYLSACFQYSVTVVGVVHFAHHDQTMTMTAHDGLRTVAALLVRAMSNTILRIP
jgi:hypothetical protein